MGPFPVAVALRSLKPGPARRTSAFAGSVPQVTRRLVRL